MHIFEGLLGHVFVIVAFVSSLLSSYAYFKGRNQDQSWTAFGSKIFYVHTLAILGIIGTLFYLISNHFFEYHYVFSHSSRLLPAYYQISCFWEGQEGSFLLWMFWNAILGVILISTNKFWKAPVMLIMSLTQVFLTSMILGVVILDVKIGSSPFMLLRDVIDAPIFKSNPNFIPEDGNGLNPLLQNYWMVIHPPTLFLGFATTVIPFAYCIGGLIIGKNKEWIRPALPWAQFSAMILGVGILMGAYWAYETLNFGGYWNWDPVENAIYIPWLILVAAIHVMIAYKKSGSALKLSLILVVASFILVLYATFLTRSGILGNSSVHSFTDLGLSGQLLLYLLAFLALSSVMIAKRWKEIPSTDQEVSTYSREFWIFMGATVLGLMSFQVLAYTSIPVYNQISDGLFGYELDWAPTTDVFKSYSIPQALLASFLAIFSGIGQFFWWKKVKDKKWLNELRVPLLLALAGTLLVVLAVDKGFFEPFQEYMEKGQVSVWMMGILSFTLIPFCSIFSIFANLKILSGIVKSNANLSGGSVAHIGVALMLVGILFSSGYSTILSKNYTSRVWNKDFPEQMNIDNLLLFLNEPRDMGAYSMVYKGMRKWTKEKGYVDAYELQETGYPLKVIEKTTKDTLTLINPDNYYFEVEYTEEDNNFTLFPRVQYNEEMGGLLPSPALKKYLSSDIYTHITGFPNLDEEPKWSEPETTRVKIGDQFFINDYIATLEKLVPIKEVDGVALSSNDIAVKAVIKVQGEYKDYTAEPVFLIRNKELVGRVDDMVNDLAFRISIDNIIPQENAVALVYQTAQKDWIIMEAVKKPWINLLWVGTLLLVVGFIVAIRRRYIEFMKMRDKGVEAL